MNESSAEMFPWEATQWNERRGNLESAKLNLIPIIHFISCMALKISLNSLGLNSTSVEWVGSYPSQGFCGEVLKCHTRTGWPRVHAIHFSSHLPSLTKNLANLTHIPSLLTGTLLHSAKNKICNICNGGGKTQQSPLV